MSNIKVIGAGLSRTGTKSLQMALNILGFGPCHHMSEVIAVDDDKKEQAIKKWLKVFEEDDMDVLKELLEPYNSTLDIPSQMYYKQILEWVPDAKVILSIRDTAEQYAKSAEAIVFNLKYDEDHSPLAEAGMNKLFHPIVLAFQKAYGETVMTPNQNLKEMYGKWNDDVIRSIDPKKLLVFNPKDGWDPLCKFLEVPVPDQPFPRTNSLDNFLKTGKLFEPY